MPPNPSTISFISGFIPENAGVELARLRDREDARALPEKRPHLLEVLHHRLVECKVFLLFTNNSAKLKIDMDVFQMYGIFCEKQKNTSFLYFIFSYKFS